MKKHTWIAILLVLAMLMSGCSKNEDNPSQNDLSEQSQQTDVSKNDSSGEILINDASGIFSDRDFKTDYDESKSAFIELNGDSATCSSDAVEISGSTITIKDEGTYILSGTLNDGMIVVDSEKTDKTQLVLNGVTIHSETNAPIYILQSDKVFITTTEGSVNTLSNGGSFEAINENNIDAVIFSKEDITLNGKGTLVVTSPAAHGIVSKDSLTITGGVYDINCASHALVGKDDVCIADGEYTIVSGKDGIHAENADDASSGFVYIQNGIFDISAEGDGISAAAYMQIEDGSFNIVSGGGSANGSNQTSDSWGDFMGGGRHQGGGRGGFGGSGMQASAESKEDDGTSIKGIKASYNLTINGGMFYIDSADDAVHSNSSVTIKGGTYEIASGDDAFHADDTLSVNAGIINITKCYEGLEGLHIKVVDGDITLVADDDGLNAAGGTDSSGMGGRDGMFGGPGGMFSGNGSITISGGTLHITASGDGIDANGTLDITGGYTVVSGPTKGDTATLDYDKSAVISGGTFIGTGASGMAQTFSGSEQGVISVSVGSQSVGTKITLTDDSGNVVMEYTPELSFAVVILSSPDIISGETYTITVGSESGEFEAD